MPTIFSMTLLMMAVCLMAYYSDRHAICIETPSGIIYREKKCVFFIILFLAYYAGMRSYGNDTTGYIRNYLNCASTLRDYFSSGEWRDDKGPLFSVLMILCKKLFKENFHLFFFAAGFLTNSLIVKFLRKYCSNLALPLFLYIAMNGYGTSLTGMRQALATAIVMWAIPYAIKKKWVKYLLMVLLAYEVHFIAIIFLIVPFILKGVWNRKIWLFVILTIIAASSFDRFGEMLLDSAELLGFEYSDSVIYGKQAINFLRVLVYWVPPVLILIKRKTLNEAPIFNQSVSNLTIIGASVVSIGLFGNTRLGNANTFGRLGLVFEENIYIALPYAISIFESATTRISVKRIMVVCFLIYYVFGHIKHGLSLDYYQLVPIWNWF